MSLPIAVNIDGGEGGRIAQSAEQKELDCGERGPYLIDTLSKRRDGISSSYPDLLDPSFGSCLRGGNPRKKAKRMVAGPCTIFKLNQVQKVIVNCLFTLKLSNLTQSLPDSAIPSKRHFVVPLSLETVPNGTFFNRSSDICL